MAPHGTTAAHLPAGTTDTSDGERGHCFCTPGATLERAFLHLVVVATVCAVPARARSQALAAHSTRPATTCQTGDTSTAGYHFDTDLSAALTRATLNSQAYGAVFLVEHRQHPEACGPRRQRTLVRLSPNYDEKQQQNGEAVITRNHNATLTQLVFLSGNHIYMSSNAHYLHNTTLGLYLQQDYNVQLGAEFLRRGATIALEAGPAYVAQHFLTATPSTGFAAMSTSERVSVPLAFIAKGAELTENARATFPLSSGNATLISSSAALRLPFLPRLALVLSAFEDYVSNAPAPLKKHSFTTTASISIRLARLAK